MDRERAGAEGGEGGGECWKAGGCLPARRAAVVVVPCTYARSHARRHGVPAAGRPASRRLTGRRQPEPWLPAGGTPRNLARFGVCTWMIARTRREGSSGWHLQPERDGRAQLRASSAVSALCVRCNGRRNGSLVLRGHGWAHLPSRASYTPPGVLGEDVTSILYLFCIFSGPVAADPSRSTLDGVCLHGFLHGSQVLS